MLCILQAQEVTAVKKVAVLSAVFFSGLAVAQGLPKFGTATIW